MFDYCTIFKYFVNKQLKGFPFVKVRKIIVALKQYIFFLTFQIPCMILKHISAFIILRCQKWFVSDNYLVSQIKYFVTLCWLCLTFPEPKICAYSLAKLCLWYFLLICRVPCSWNKISVKRFASAEKKFLWDLRSLFSSKCLFMKDVVHIQQLDIWQP